MGGAPSSGTRWPLLSCTNNNLPPLITTQVHRFYGIRDRKGRYQLFPSHPTGYSRALASMLISTVTPHGHRVFEHMAWKNLTLVHQHMYTNKQYYCISCCFSIWHCSYSIAIQYNSLRLRAWVTASSATRRGRYSPTTYHDRICTSPFTATIAQSYNRL